MDSHRLGLNAPQHRGSPAFVLKRVGVLASDVLVAPATVGQERTQIALCPTGNEQRCLLAQQFGHVRFESRDRWVVTEDIVAHGSGCYRRTHVVARSGNGVRT